MPFRGSLAGGWSAARWDQQWKEREQQGMFVSTHSELEGDGTFVQLDGNGIASSDFLSFDER